MVALGRREWVQADLRCMLCGRTLGRLLGPASGAEYQRGAMSCFTAFRPADSSLPAVRLSGSTRFRCTTCGGGTMVDDLERFTTDDTPLDADNLERPRRGRPPKPWRTPVDSRLVELGIAV